MDRNRIPDDALLRQGSVNVISDYLNSLYAMFHQDGMYPHAPNIYIQHGWPTNDYAQFYPRETDYFYMKYFFNLQAQLYTEEPCMIDMESRDSEIMAYSNYCRPTFYEPNRRSVSPSSGQAAENDGKGESQEDMGKTSKDIVWQLNQRRPSVIRRSISSDNGSSPREAVLTTTWTARGPCADDIAEEESSTQWFPSTTEYPRRNLSEEAEDEVEVGTEPNDSRALGDVRSISTEETTGETRIAKSKITVNSIKSAKKREFHCSFCKKHFRWFSHWVAHERIHTGERPFTCRHCGRAFTRADGLQCHVQTHFKQKYYKCSICSTSFAKKAWLERHVFNHTGEKPFKCEYCNRQFCDSESIEIHLLSHKGEKRFKCQYCNYSFVNAKRLVRHIRGHTGEKPFKCQVCKVTFSKKSALVIHHRVHTGIKPYTCPVCGKSFSISGNLHRHRLIHTGERPYKCLKCQRTFNNPSHLSRHITSQHTK